MVGCLSLKNKGLLLVTEGKKDRYRRVLPKYTEVGTGVDTENDIPKSRPLFRI